MNEGAVAELIGDTLIWATGKADVPAIANIEIVNTIFEGESVGEIAFTVIGGQRFRLIVEEDT